MTAELFTVALIGSFLEKAAGKAAEMAVTEAVSGLKKIHPNAPIPPRRNQPDFVAATHLTVASLRNHIIKLRKWSSSAHIAESEEHKSISQIYVDLDTYLLPLNKHESTAEQKRTKPLIQALCNEPNNIVLLGGPGAGKTTSLKKISVDYFLTGRALLNFNFPVLIELRALSRSASAHPIIDSLQEIFSIGIAFPQGAPSLPAGVTDGIITASVAAYINELNCLILLDGFDEISENSAKAAIMEDVISLSKHLTNSRFILTSRSRDFRYAGESIKFFELAPLTPPQIREFARKWLGVDEEANDFLLKVQLSPFADTAIRPLTIAHLCAIYQRTKTIPDKPKSVYRRVVNLLLKEWDDQREVQRTSKYAGFDVDRKMEFLGQLAFELTTYAKTLRFSSSTLKEIYRKIHADHGLPQNDAENVVHEIESHNGLLVKSGYDHYEFAHKSLQEFLTADYIVRLPSLVSIVDVIDLLANELAIAVSLSSKPGDYLCEILLRILDNKKFSRSWYAIFATRLIQEKPELSIGDSIFTTIAYFALLTNLDEPEKTAGLLRSAIPMQPLKSLSIYYTVEERGRDFTKLSRKSHHSHLKLPALLKVPNSVL